VAGGLLTLVLAATACGGSGSDSSQVASLSTDGATGATTATTAPVDSQEAWLSFAQCMRDNGVDMQDPTFDADGNLASGGIGPDSGIDMRDETVQTAMGECGDLIADLGPGGGNGGPQFDRTAIQDALNGFTECLRDNGVQVDDIDFSVGPGGGDGPGGPDGTAPDGAAPQGTGDVPAGGFGTPPDGSAPTGPGGPGGDGFDPTARIIEQLGLDDTDPAVTAALTTCQPELDAAFDQTGDGTAATDTTTGS
jgi:hypothetical protein